MLYTFDIDVYLHYEIHRTRYVILLKSWSGLITFEVFFGLFKCPT